MRLTTRHRSKAKILTERSSMHLASDRDPEDNAISAELFGIFPGLKRFLKVVVPVVLISLLILMHSSRLDALYYERPLELALILLVAGVIPTLSFFGIRLWFAGTGVKTTAATCAFALTLLNIAGSAWHHKTRLRNVLESTGKQTTAVVTSTYRIKGSPYLQYEFDAGPDRVSYKMANAHGYATGDTIQIIYAPDRPAMNIPIRDFHPGE